MKKITKGLLILATLCLFPIASASARVSHLGGTWNYGGHHDPANWGAFSNFYHVSFKHYSSVQSKTFPNNQSVSNAPAGSFSHAFINTSVGEQVYFDAGLGYR